ncbi:Plasmid pRiA4b ORF-3-like protein [Planoprotostelium fungivorum]|uniref:Plasmid pRiA4b ORF-3-like protein n=1 Tax=Planoprotostelium fungivorum TaxID=1890364 RepID=A0A2P6N776_9EUKA|nr:Plasmid pRiA4b ORF-3-like protein [Planoprotostelium fungivorum]
MPKGTAASTNEGKFAFAKRFKCWAIVSSPITTSFEDLFEQALDKCFAFDFDHLWSTTLKGKNILASLSGNPTMPDSKKGIFGTKITLEKLALAPGDSCDIWYDYGDDWHFTFTVEGESMEDEEKGFFIVKKGGKPPPQY